MKALANTQPRAGLALAVAAVLLLAACAYKKEALPVPTVPCTLPASVTYKNNVWPILKANCRDACHNDRDAVAYYNFSMDQFSQVQYYCTHTPPSVPSGSTPWLLGNVKRLGNGYSDMPVGAGKLSDCDIAIIEAWIKDGAPNN